MGFLKARSGPDAIIALEEAVKLAPAHPSIRYHLGLAYAREGRNQEARQELETAFQISPKFEDAGEANQLLTQLQ